MQLYAEMHLHLFRMEYGYSVSRHVVRSISFLWGVFFFFFHWHPFIIFTLTGYFRNQSFSTFSSNPVASLIHRKSQGCQWIVQRRPFNTWRYTTFSEKNHKVWMAVTTPTRTFCLLGRPPNLTLYFTCWQWMNINFLPFEIFLLTRYSGRWFQFYTEVILL